MSYDRKVLRSKENLYHDGGGYTVRPEDEPRNPGWGGGNDSKVAAKSSRPSKIAPGQPKPPRSAFICFTDAKTAEYVGTIEDNDNFLNLLADEWGRLTPAERSEWDEVARNDKLRYARENEAYKGPKHVPKRRAKKNPLAPRRPPSAFLYFSKSRREMVKRENPDLINTDISRLLGQMWRNLSEKEREPYERKTREEHATYKLKIKKFKEDEARKDAASRTSHRTVRKVAANLAKPKRSPSYDNPDLAPLPLPLPSVPPAPPVHQGQPHHYHGQGNVPSENRTTDGQLHHYHSYYPPMAHNNSFDYAPYEDSRYSHPSSGTHGYGGHPYHHHSYMYGDYHGRHHDYQYNMEPNHHEADLLRHPIRLPSIEDDDRDEKVAHSHQQHSSQSHDSGENNNSGYFPNHVPEPGFYWPH